MRISKTQPLTQIGITELCDVVNVKWHWQLVEKWKVAQVANYRKSGPVYTQRTFCLFVFVFVFYLWSCSSLRNVGKHYNGNQALYLWSSLFPPPFLSDLVAESSHNFLDIGKCHHFCQAPPPRELNPRKFPASLKDKRDTYTIFGAYGKRRSKKNTACQTMRPSKHNVEKYLPHPHFLSGTGGVSKTDDFWLSFGWWTFFIGGTDIWMLTLKLNFAAFYFKICPSTQFDGFALVGKSF